MYDCIVHVFIIFMWDGKLLVCVCVCVRLYLRMYVGIYIMCIMRAFVNTIRSSTLSQVVTHQDNL